jgi:hypothetical protein
MQLFNIRSANEGTDDVLEPNESRKSILREQNARFKVHCSITVMHLFHGQRNLGPNFAYLKVLDTLVVLLAVASRVIWFFVFRDLHKFVHFHRPSEGYRWAI